MDSLLANLTPAMADSAGADSIANREDAIPVLDIPLRNDLTASSSEAESESTTAKKLKDQAKKAGEVYSTNELKQSIQDRFFEGLLSKVIPTEQLNDADQDAARKAKIDPRSRKYVERPNFSLSVMNSNFRRFNSRVGIVFVMQNRLIHLLTWRNPTATASFLAVYCLLCLEPYLIPLIPLIGVLLSIMTPSFIARHPISRNDPRIEPSFRGPATAPPSRVKPAPELSKDFFRNMRDLQNSMEDFSRLHDAANEYITPYTNFSDEKLSSGLYAAMFATSCLAFIGSQLVPWRFVALITGSATILSGHPSAQTFLLSSRTLKQLRTNLSSLATLLRNWLETDITLDDPLERRQVEIFELQKYHPHSDSWEPWLFSPSPHDPLSPVRIAGTRAKGTQFFEDVQTPAGWAWKDSKWTLDLASRGWVEQRMITGVEIETEGERWVYDLPQEAVEMMEGGSGGGGGGNSGKTTQQRKKVAKPKSGWEEGNGLGDRGEWRRRRWVRLVERVVKVDGKPG